MSNRLITIPISHYCEKARWALQRSGIPFREERHLQGFHLLPTYRAAKTDSVPVLVTANGILRDSTDILRWCDSKSDSARKLFPESPALRREIERFEDRLDEGFGVAGRLWLYTFTLDRHSFITRYAKRHEVPRHQALLMPLLYPLIRRKMREFIRLSPNSRKESQAEIDRVFDEVGRMLADGRPYLFGSAFSAADLTFAALSAPGLIPENYGVTLPKLEELPEAMAAQIRKWRSHPAGEFALRLYREHRDHAR